MTTVALGSNVHPTNSAGVNTKDDSGITLRWVLSRLKETGAWSRLGISGPRQVSALLTVGGAAAALVPLLAFLGSTFIEPATRPPEILPTVTMSIAGVEHSQGSVLAAVTIRTAVRNPTNARVLLLADTLNVQAFKTIMVPNNNPSGPSDDSAYASNLGLYYDLGLHGSSKVAKETASSDESKSAVLQSVTVSRYAVNDDQNTQMSPFIYAMVPFRTAKGWFVDPQEEDSRTDVLFVPVAKWDYLHLKLDVYSGRDSELLKSVDVRYYLSARGEITVDGRLIRLNGTTDFGSIDLAQATDYGLIYGSTTFDLPLWQGRLMQPSEETQK
jgi:hypothetical protein